MSTKKTTATSIKAKELGDGTKATASMVAEAMGVMAVGVTEKTADEMAKKRIYAGPNILGLITYTVVEGEYPEHIKKFIEDCAEIGKMFVPIEKLAETERKKIKKGTIENRNYKIVQSFLKGEDEE